MLNVVVLATDGVCTAGAAHDVVRQHFAALHARMEGRIRLYALGIQDAHNQAALQEYANVTGVGWIELCTTFEDIGRLHAAAVRIANELPEHAPELVELTVSFPGMARLDRIVRVHKATDGQEDLIAFSSIGRSYQEVIETFEGNVLFREKLSLSPGERESYYFVVWSDLDEARQQIQVSAGKQSCLVAFEVGSAPNEVIVDLKRVNQFVQRLAQLSVLDNLRRWLVTPPVNRAIFEEDLRGFAQTMDSVRPVGDARAERVRACLREIIAEIESYDKRSWSTGQLVGRLRELFRVSSTVEVNGLPEDLGSRWTCLHPECEHYNWEMTNEQVLRRARPRRDRKRAETATDLAVPEGTPLMSYDLASRCWRCERCVVGGRRADRVRYQPPAGGWESSAAHSPSIEVLRFPLGAEESALGALLSSALTDLGRLERVHVIQPTPGVTLHLNRGLFEEIATLAPQELGAVSRKYPAYVLEDPRSRETLLAFGNPWYRLLRSDGHRVQQFPSGEYVVRHLDCLIVGRGLALRFVAGDSEN